MSTEADIVEKLLEKRGVLDNRWPGPTYLDKEAAAEITKLRAERDALQSHNSELRWDQLQPALSRITELEAERDAAAQDMRERCAKVEGVEGDVETATCAFEGGYLVGFNDCHYRFSAAIRALPLAVVATEETGQ